RERVDRAPGAPDPQAGPEAADQERPRFEAPGDTVVFDEWGWPDEFRDAGWESPPPSAYHAYSLPARRVASYGGVGSPLLGAGTGRRRRRRAAVSMAAWPRSGAAPTDPGWPSGAMVVSSTWRRSARRARWVASWPCRPMAHPRCSTTRHGSTTSLPAPRSASR